MAIAKVNFYWNGNLIEAGTEAPEGAPKSLTVQDEKKVVKKKEKASTKNGKPENLEDK
jgi:hypothetical protein